jgi:hypothetical protein
VLDAQPPEEHVAGRLHQLLALDDATALVHGPAATGVRLEHGRLGLLDLQEERVGGVAAEQQRDPGARAHATHADHLVRDVDKPVGAQEVAPVVLQGLLVVAQVGAQPLADDLRAIVAADLVDRYDQWRIADDARLAGNVVGQLGERTEAVLAPGLGQRLVEVLASRPAQVLGDLLLVQPGVPDVDRAHRRERAHRPAVGARRATDGVAAHAAAESAIAARHLDARGQALDVPFPGPGQGLVEVVDVEDEPAVRCGEPAEVGEVRIAAQLDARAADRRAGEVGGHDRRGAAEEREGRAHHAAVADGHELGRPRARLSHEDLDRIGAIHQRLTDRTWSQRTSRPRGSPGAPPRTARST